MNGDIYKRITLSGSMPGFVRVRESGTGARLELSVEGLAEGMGVYTVSTDSVRRTEYSGPGIITAGSGVTAVALESGGRIVSAGFSGGSRAERARILDELRIRAAGERETSINRAKAEERPKPVREIPVPEPHVNASPVNVSPVNASPVNVSPANDPPAPSRAEITDRILKQAERLFASIGAEEGPEDAPTPIKNPFPKAYPNSEWQVLPGDERLYGTAVINGRKVSLTALPAEAKAKNAARPYRSAVLISTEGKRYFIVRGTR